MNRDMPPINRRVALRIVAGTGAAMVIGAAGEPSARASPNPPPLDERKLILVLFGGGTRSSEAIDDPEHRWIPHLWKELVPRGTLWTNMRVEHRVVHPNCNASIKTGHWEWDDLDWEKPPRHPTVFEIIRKARQLPDTAAWSFVYASILAQTGMSTAEGYGPRFAANVVQPPTIPRTAAEKMDGWMATARASGSPEAETEAADRCARLARSESAIATGQLKSETARHWVDEQYHAWRAKTGTTSHDVFLADRACECMKRFSPVVMSVDFGEIDCAHYGSWSRYVEAIRRTDQLTHRIWQTAQSLPDYRDKTLMLILPDHGRELERTGGSGYVHHSDFYTGAGADEGCRRVWMLTLGPGVRAGHKVAHAVPITAVAATGLGYFSLTASPGAASSALEKMGAYSIRATNGPAIS